MFRKSGVHKRLEAPQDVLSSTELLGFPVVSTYSQSPLGCLYNLDSWRSVFKRTSKGTSSATESAFVFHLLKEVPLEIHFFSTFMNAIIPFFCSSPYFIVLPRAPHFCRSILSPFCVCWNVSVYFRILNLTNFPLPDLISCWGCSWGR
jgi:hypothetical protein